MNTEDPKQAYEFKLRLLGNEVFAIGISSSTTSNKWVAIALVSIFSIMTVLGAYGEKLIAFFKALSS